MGIHWVDTIKQPLSGVAIPKKDEFCISWIFISLTQACSSFFPLCQFIPQGVHAADNVARHMEFGSFDDEEDGNIEDSMEALKGQIE